jgi:hypothetical protein
VLVVGRGEQELGAVGRAARDHDDVGSVDFALAVALDNHLGDRGAVRIGVQRKRMGVGEQRDVLMLERRADAEHLGVRLGMHQAREAIAAGTAHAGAEWQV